MNAQQQEASAIAHELVVYLESEQADVKATDNKFDALWQSIYDVCKLVNFGIIEDIDEYELNEAVAWLRNTQDLTKDYKNKEIDI